MRHGTWVDLPQDAPETMAMAGEIRNLYFMGIGSNAFSVGFACGPDLDNAWRSD